MMRARYFVSVQRQPGDASRVAVADGMIFAKSGLTLLDVEGPATIATADPAPLIFRDGVIIGDIYRNGDIVRAASLTDDEIDRVAHTAGQSLIDEFWGAYIAVLTSPNHRTVRIVRAPFGELPCLYLADRTRLVAASDPGLLVELAGYRPAIDWVAMSWHLARRDLRFASTCLADIRELHGGDVLVVSAEIETSALWTPWTWASRASQFRDKDEAIAAVRKAVMYSVRACSHERRSVLLLSGGIDSSIVASALAAAGADFACLSLTTCDGAGDELEYAQAVCDRVARPLRTFRRDITQVDLGRSAAARQARPVGRSFAQETRRAVRETASETGADLVLGGGGGDNVFCSLQSGGPAADLLLTHGPGPSFFATAASIAEIAAIPIAPVIRDAIKRAFRSRAAQQAAIDARLLGASGLACAADAPAHPWFVPPQSVLTGKAGHVRLLAYAQSYVESFDPLDPIPMTAPLIAQPVVEACLRVPSWFWFNGGRNRMIARYAFRRELPTAIYERKSKGSPESFVGEIYESNRSAIRELLLDGALAANGIIDRGACEALLGDRMPAHGTGFLRILEFADAEAWIASWQGSAWSGSG